MLLIHVINPRSIYQSMHLKLTFEYQFMDETFINLLYERDERLSNYVNLLHQHKSNTNPWHKLIKSLIELVWKSKNLTHYIGSINYQFM